MTGFSLLNILS